MVERTVIIKNKTGLHARPASKFVQTASKFKSSIILTTDGRTTNAKSIITLLSMGIHMGSEITISAEGKDESLAVKTLVDLIDRLAEEE